jgi:probable rRNA maturation factor
MSPHPRIQPRHDSRESGAPLTVTVHRRTSSVGPGLTRFLETSLTAIARLAGLEEGSVAVALVDARQMRRMHRKFMGLDSPTDVLTFDLRQRPMDLVEADLVLCVNVARKQAKQRGHPLRLELLLYGVHGLLHLLGYDDHAPPAAARMHRREDALLRAAGFPAVYRRGSRSFRA